MARETIQGNEANRRMTLAALAVKTRGMGVKE
jgi:hypothetical protein